MSTTETKKPKPGRHVTVTLNNKPLELPDREVTGLEIKQEAIDQGIEIELDFELILEAHGGHGARKIADDEAVKVKKHDIFTANDGDDDS